MEKKYIRQASWKRSRVLAPAKPAHLYGHVIQLLGLSLEDIYTSTLKTYISEHYYQSHLGDGKYPLVYVSIF